VRKVVEGRLGRVLFVRLAPGDDLYDAILEVAAQEKIRTGVVLDVTGAATSLRLALPSEPTEGHLPPGIVELHGLAELMGSGIIGHVEQDFVSADGRVAYRAGDPYLHLHVSATVNGVTYTGHLVEGTRVRSIVENSHFTIVLGEVEGVDLAIRVDPATSQHYPSGVPYHEIRSVGRNELR
jgi:predicted DNA-binding protein with PD1-like motif